MSTTNTTTLSDRFADSLTARMKKISEKKKPVSAQTVNRAVAAALLDCMCELPTRKSDSPRAAYFSAEFLPGNLTTQGLAALGLERLCEKILRENGLDPELLTLLPDPALGNGGLGRLAACLLDSAAACDVPLDGYGIRYRYGIFKQEIHGAEQTERPDEWQQSCPFEQERRDEAQKISFGDGDVLAVPFDIPIAGKSRINRLRLWQCEPMEPVDFTGFAAGDYCKAFARANAAAAVSAFLYPPDDTKQGKELRLKQQYFFSAASVEGILKDFEKTGEPITALSDYIKIQLNDTHPTVAVPELLRRLCEDYSLSFEDAFALAGEIFSYTNHTVMAEALESWEVSLFCRVLPQVYPYIVMLNNRLACSLRTKEQFRTTAIIQNNRISMANLAVYVSHKVNGVAKIHSEIIKESVFADWYRLYPDRFINITNGISHRRWLCLANPELSAFADRRLGDGWREDLTLLEEIRNYDSEEDLSELLGIKHQKKVQLAEYLKEQLSVSLDPDFMFSVQIKRIHEYKRQLLNILAVLGLYIDIKSGAVKDFYPTAFLFAGKAAPGYYNAKQIIKLINRTSALIERDETARKLLKVVFIPDYNVKNAMKIIPAADLSEQLSTAGTEASGTGNMKLSLNGAPTIGTLDGATIEIVDYAGRENNYIFGATKEEFNSLYDYDPMNIYYTNDRISRVIDLLKDGPAGDYEALFKSLLFGSDWEPADRYKVLMDYPSYFEARLKANEDYRNSREYGKKCLRNIAAAAHFSSDRTIRDYNNKIWRV